MAISISDLTKVVKKEPFDIKWNTILTVKDDKDLNKSTDELMNYFSSNDDDAKIFLIVKNKELGYLYSRDYLPTIVKLLDRETRSIGGDPTILPGESNITISSGNRINYICPRNDCNYKIEGLDLQDPRLMCEIHEDEELVKEQT